MLIVGGSSVDDLVRMVDQDKSIRDQNGDQGVILVPSSLSMTLGGPRSHDPLAGYPLPEGYQLESNYGWEWKQLAAEVDLHPSRYVKNAL